MWTLRSTVHREPIHFLSKQPFYEDYTTAKQDMSSEGKCTSSPFSAFSASAQLLHRGNSYILRMLVLYVYEEWLHLHQGRRPDLTKAFDSMARASSNVCSPWAAWVAYAASGWALLFAALSFFWAAGGRTGLHPLELEAAYDDSVWVLISLGAGIIKVVIGLIALALVQLWGRIFPRRLLLACTWMLGIGMSLYGGLGLVSDVLHVTGVTSDPENGKWFFWYLVLWDPWWVLGGILYLAVAWFAQRIPLSMETTDASQTEAGF